VIDGLIVVFPPVSRKIDKFDCFGRDRIGETLFRSRCNLFDKRQSQNFLKSRREVEQFLFLVEDSSQSKDVKMRYVNASCQVQQAVIQVSSPSSALLDGFPTLNLETLENRKTLGL
jgi:hypothetical protein